MLMCERKRQSSDFGYRVCVCVCDCIGAERSVFENKISISNKVFVQRESQFDWQWRLCNGMRYSLFVLIFVPIWHFWIRGEYVIDNSSNLNVCLWYFTVTNSYIWWKSQFLWKSNEYFKSIFVFNELCARFEILYIEPEGFTQRFSLKIHSNSFLPIPINNLFYFQVLTMQFYPGQLVRSFHRNLKACYSSWKHMMNTNFSKSSKSIQFLYLRLFTDYIHL